MEGEHMACTLHVAWDERLTDAANVDLKGFTGEPLMTARELLAELLT